MDEPFLYQKSGRYFAQIADGLEELGAGELSELGASEISPIYRGIYFEADKPVLYGINYRSRLITRVLAPLITFDCHSVKYLQKTAKSIRWQDIFPLEKTFAVFATVSHSSIRHSQYAALCLKDAIVDSFREHCGKRPNVETRDPDLWFNLHIEKNRATISIDTSGGSLHRRGYRSQSVEVPIQETVAAAILRLSGWDGSSPLYDPMCGSGTLVCEALMSYCRMPAATLRKRFGFEMLPDFDRKIWQRVKTEADQQMQALPEGLISASDLSDQAVSITKNNLSSLRHHQGVTVKTADFRNIPELENRMIVCNPPYGLRIGKGADLDNFYKDLGDFMKQRCRGSSAYIYFGKREFIKRVGLKPSWKKPLKNGGLDGRLVKYELY
jgi:putative N6-adenine-specific DNA methylase